MRPESIRKFDLFYLSSIAVSAVASFLGYDAAVRQAEELAAASGIAIGSPFVTSSLVIGLLISLLVWYLVSRKGFAIAKWLLVLFLLVGLIGLPGVLRGGLAVSETVSLVGLVLQAIAIWYLFQSDAKVWFAQKHDGGGGKALD